MEHTRFFDQIPKLWGENLKNAQGKERKSALALLSEIVRDGNAELSDMPLQLARSYGRGDVESVRQCYYTLTGDTRTLAPVALGFSTPQLGCNPSLSPYDDLIGKESGVAHA